MPIPNLRDLTKREREILYAVYELHPVTVQKICEHIQSDISYNGVRRILDSLVTKELVKFEAKRRKHVYSPVQSSIDQGTRILREVIQTFFGESAALGFASLLKSKDSRLQELEINNLRQLLKEQRESDND